MTTPIDHRKRSWWGGRTLPKIRLGVVALLTLALHSPSAGANNTREKTAHDPRELLSGVDNMDPEPASEPIDRQYVHEGFYLRMSVGRGGDWGGVGPYYYRTSGISWDVLVGGSSQPGLAWGGGIFANGSMFTRVKRGDVEVPNSRAVGSVIIGPFVDGFPNPRGGIHYGTAMGAAGSMMTKLTRGVGFGYAGWIGYDHWMAPGHTAGVLLRGTVNHTFWGQDVMTEEPIRGSSGSVDLVISLLFY